MAKIKVVFRKYKEGDIIALFPEIKESDYKVSCYQHVGQHGLTDYHETIKCTKLATDTEYQDLKKELETIGYEVTVLKRAKLSY